MLSLWFQSLFVTAASTILINVRTKWGKNGCENIVQTVEYHTDLPLFNSLLQKVLGVTAKVILK